MKITIEPTTQLVDFNGVQCRVWDGQTEDGTRCHLFVTQVAVATDEPPEKMAQFERQLLEQRAPLVVWPTRMIL